jgi:hypothetical protein
MWEGYRTTIPLPTYWWPRRDHTPRTTVRTTDATAKTLSTSFDLVPPLNEHRGQRWSLTCIVNCKGNDTTDIHSGTRHHYSHRPPWSSSPAVPGSHLCVFPCKLIPQRRSHIHYDHCTTIQTYGWLPPSLNLGLSWELTHGALFLNGTGSCFYVSPRQLIPQRRSPPTLARLTARPSPLTDDCLIASTWDFAATTRSASIYPNNGLRFPACSNP